MGWGRTGQAREKLPAPSAPKQEIQYFGERSLLIVPAPHIKTAYVCGSHMGSDAHRAEGWASVPFVPRPSPGSPQGPPRPSKEGRSETRRPQSREDGVCTRLSGVERECLPGVPVPVPTVWSRNAQKRLSTALASVSWARFRVTADVLLL